MNYRTEKRIRYSRIKHFNKYWTTNFDMKKLSIVAKDFHTEENVVGYYNTGERMKFWGQQGHSGEDFGECYLVLHFAG